VAAAIARSSPATLPLKMFSRTARSSRIAARLAIALVVLLIGVWLGGHPSWLPAPLRSAFVEDGGGQLVNQALDIIERDYSRRVSRGQLVNSSLAAAVASLHDPFSQYISPSDYRAFGHPSPHISGIGIDVKPDSRGLRVVGVFPGTPAAQAGLAPGDVIVAVGTTSLVGHSADFDSGLIRGRAGTAVQLTLIRSGRRQVMQITRRRFTLPIADDRLLNHNAVKLGYVQLTTFNQDGAGDQVRADVEQLLRQGARGIILDLRGNGGGLISEAVSVASIFLADGTIASTAGRNSPRQVFTATGKAIAGKIPVVVLVDHGTASASEIVTAALQDRHRALVIGSHTFGKGVFQEVQQLPNGGALDITAGYYFTPSGRNLGGGGVREGAGVDPNVVARDNPRTPRDEALAVAERVLAAKVQ
jgi:carboxyl-terminal processing protease